jgi:5'(3')-deoxyribonucleotidase
MSRLRIGLDVDGVIADMTTPACVIMSEMLGRPFSPAEVVRWDFDHALPPEQRPLFWERMGVPGFCRAIPPYEGAVEAVRRLEEIADVYLVTSPLPCGQTWTHERDAWAQHHFEIPRRRIIHTAAKHLVAVHMLIDDRPQNLSEWATEHPGCPVLWRQPYNAEHDILPEISSRLLHTDSWDDVIFRTESMTCGR